MTLLLWMFRILILLIVIRFIVVMVRSAMVAAGGGSAQGPARARRSKREPERIGGTLVRDPQCGTYLPEDRAITVRSGSSAHHFCSVACRDQWEARGR